MFSSTLIEGLGLETLVETEAVLADGTKVTLETFVAYLDWFGELIPVIEPSAGRREQRTVPAAGDRPAREASTDNRRHGKDGRSGLGG